MIKVKQFVVTQDDLDIHILNLWASKVSDDRFLPSKEDVKLFEKTIGDFEEKHGFSILKAEHHESSFGMVITVSINE